MVVEAVNATGWSSLYDSGSLINASWTMWTWYLGDFFFTILFMVFQFMLMSKTRSPLLGLFTTGMVLGVAYAKNLLSAVVIGFLALYAVFLIVWILINLIIKDSPQY